MAISKSLKHNSYWKNRFLFQDEEPNIVKAVREESPELIRDKRHLVPIRQSHRPAPSSVPQTSSIPPPPPPPMSTGADAPPPGLPRSAYVGTGN